MIHVLHITTVPKSLRFIQGQIPFMNQRGVSLSFATSSAKELEHFKQFTGAKVYTIEMPRKISPLADLKAVVKLAQLILTLKPDIIHAHTPKGGLLGMLAATLCNHPARVYHMRGLPFMTATGAKRLLLTLTEAISCTCSHQTICVSNSLRKVALSHRLIPNTKIKVMAGGSGQGVDALQRFHPDNYSAEQRHTLRTSLGIPEDATVIGFIGRLVRDKGVCELAQAWETLHTQYPNAHMVCVGDFEERDPVPDHVQQQLANLPRLHMVGWRENTPDYYNIMDLVTLPTYREGFPNVPLEAAAMGLPVVATHIPGCVDAVQDGVTGILVPSKNANALQEALALYLEDEERRLRDGQAGRSRVLAHFLPEQIFQDIYTTYQSLMTR